MLLYETFLETLWGVFTQNRDRLPLETLHKYFERLDAGEWGRGRNCKSQEKILVANGQLEYYHPVAVLRFTTYGSSLTERYIKQADQRRSATVTAN